MAAGAGVEIGRVRTRRAGTFGDYAGPARESPVLGLWRMWRMRGRWGGGAGYRRRASRWRKAAAVSSRMSS